MATKKNPSPNAEAKPAKVVIHKKGTRVSWNTAGRGSSKSYAGTVVAFVDAGATPALPKKLMEEFGAPSNRARYLIEVENPGEKGPTHRWANAKSIVVAA